MHRHNVDETIVVDVGHHQSITAAEHKVQNLGVINQMLLPADKAAIVGGSLGELIADALRQQIGTQGHTGQCQ